MLIINIRYLTNQMRKCVSWKEDSLLINQISANVITSAGSASPVLILVPIGDRPARPFESDVGPFRNGSLNPTEDTKIFFVIMVKE